MSSGVREPVAAGSLYPMDSQALRTDIDKAINSASSEFMNPKVLILPDVGLCAAPDVAASGMVMLEAERENIDRVVLIADYQQRPGDNRFAGVAVPRSIAMRTPLGDVLLDRDSIEQISELPPVVASNRPFALDTSLEVHLPPVQRLLGSVRILPMLVGDIHQRDLVDILERVWGDRRTLIIVSANFAYGKDRLQVEASGKAARKAVDDNEQAQVLSSSTSSAVTIAALMSVVARRSMGALELDSQVIVEPNTGVGYRDVATFAAWESSDPELQESDASYMRKLALSTVQFTVLGGRVAGSDLGRVPPALAARRASVVTLRRGSQVRGSAGTIEADRSLAGSVIRNAAAACADPRLASIQPNELDEIKVEVTVISPIERIFPTAWSELATLLEPQKHGVLIIGPSGRSAQLPSLWSRLPSHDQFVASLANKANLAASERVDVASWYRFEALSYK